PAQAMASDENPPIAITVNGEPWTLRRSLADSGPESRVFTWTSTPDGSFVAFGDGIHGKVPPAGARIVLAIAPSTPLPVSLHRTPTQSTPDQSLWTVVRRRADATEVEFQVPCPASDEPGHDHDSGRRAARWRKVALLLGLGLIALALWCA